MGPHPLASGLYTDFYELTMAQGYFLQGMQDITAVFDLYFRTCPFGGGYAVAAGIAEAVDAALSVRFSDDDCRYLADRGLHPDFLAYLKNFRFTGDIDGCREGDMVFPETMLLRVAAPIIQAQLLESLLLNIVNFQTLIATKTMRTVHAAQGRPVIDFGLRRAQGQASIAAARAAFIGGATGTSNTFAARLYGIPAVGTHAHSWVQSFDDEYAAFAAYASLYPDAVTLLVDTYDTLRSGIPNAIRVARELSAAGKRLRAVRIDSGDLYEVSVQARAMLDAAGLSDVNIIASDQLDEYRIADLLQRGAPLDMFGVGTKLVCAYDQPALDGVYKLCECGGRPCLKRSEAPEKINNPGRKKVVRCVGANGRFAADAILLGNEDPHDLTGLHDIALHDRCICLDAAGLQYEPVTIPLVRAGTPVASWPTLAEIQAFAQKQWQRLPEGCARLRSPDPYPVGLSGRLARLKRSLLQRRHEHD